MLNEEEPPELPAELEGGEDGVHAGEGDERARARPERAVRLDLVMRDVMHPHFSHLLCRMAMRKYFKQTNKL